MKYVMNIFSDADSYAEYLNGGCIHVPEVNFNSEAIAKATTMNLVNAGAVVVLKAVKDAKNEAEREARHDTAF